MTKLPLSSFKQLFEPNIRAMLNWDLLAAHDAFADTHVISTTEELGSLFTVWHVNMQQEPASWDDLQAQPLPVSKASEDLSLWPEHRRHTVSQFQNHYLSSPEPVNLLLPAYRAGARLILLDSTHRAVAVHQGALDFTAMVVTLNGPINEHVLPDLRWHASNP
jgi:hypothetical protein